MHLCLQCFDAVSWTAGMAKTKWWGAGMVICLERGADMHMAQLMPLPLTVSCFSKIHISFTFLVPAHLGGPGQGAIKRCVCVCVCGCAGQPVADVAGAGRGRVRRRRLTTTTSPASRRHQRDILAHNITCVLYLSNQTLLVVDLVSVFGR